MQYAYLHSPWKKHALRQDKTCETYKTYTSVYRPHEKTQGLLVIIFFRQKPLQNLSYTIKTKHVNDNPHQVLDDKVFICHEGLAIHSKGSILVKNGPEALVEKRIV